MKSIAAGSDQQPVEIRDLNGATAVLAHQVPSPYFNQVIGLRAGHARPIGELDAWYRQNRITSRFVAAPCDFSPALAAKLTKCGYTQTGFDIQLYGLPRADADLPPAVISIVAVSGAEALEEFFDVYLIGWGIP